MQLIAKNIIVARIFNSVLMMITSTYDEIKNPHCCSSGDGFNKKSRLLPLRRQLLIMAGVLTFTAGSAVTGLHRLALHSIPQSPAVTMTYYSVDF